MTKRRLNLLTHFGIEPLNGNHSLNRKERFKLPRNRAQSRRPLSDNEKAILTMLGQIPFGRVATYGQIAKLAGIPRNSRQVGAVLRMLPPNSGVPWFRVVNSKGQISHRECASDSGRTQREILEAEGIEFSGKDTISLKKFRWDSD